MHENMVDSQFLAIIQLFFQLRQTGGSNFEHKTCFLNLNQKLALFKFISTKSKICRASMII